VNVGSRRLDSDLQSTPFMRHIVIEPPRLVPALALPLRLIPVEVDEHLGLLVLGEPAVRLGHALDVDLAADDERRRRPAALDQVPQDRLVPADLGHARADGEALHPELADGHGERARRGVGPGRARGRPRRGPVDADEGDAAAGGRHGDAAGDHVVDLGLEVPIDALEADAVQAARDAAGFMLHDLRDGVDLGEVDGDGADGSGLLQAVAHMVDAVDDAGAAQDGAVRGEEADGAGSKDSDGVAGLEAGGLDTPPAGGR